MPNHKTWLSLIILTGGCFLTTRSQEENTVGSVLDDAKVTTYSYSVATVDNLPEATTVQHVSVQSEAARIGGEETSTTDFGKSSNPSWQSSVPVVASFPSTWRPPETSSVIKDSDQTEDNSVNSVVHPSKDDDREIQSPKNVSDLIDPNLTTAKTKDEQPLTEKVPTEEPPFFEDSESEWADVDYCVLTQIECVEPVQCKGKGNVDCSPQDKQSWLSEDYNSSLIDQLLPREPRLRRSANTKLARDRKRNQGSRNRNRESPSVQEDDDLDKEPCRMEETLLCTAELNLVNCRGIGRCDAAPPDTTGSYLADWEIAVIAVLTLAGVLLVVFLVYIIYGAWRKKKVQPLNHRQGRSNS